MPVCFAMAILPSGSSCCLVSTISRPRPRWPLLCRHFSDPKSYLLESEKYKCQAELLINITVAVRLLRDNSTEGMGGGGTSNKSNACGSKHSKGL
jgi:hypothetical protein